jgi:DNA-binding Lrp family transcriptional regulator
MGRQPALPGRARAGHAAGWLHSGALKRFGTIVRHHELGFDANAMTVFDVPDARVDACGEALAAEPGITLSYRRERAPDWPYNLYCMVHGRDREAVRDVLERVIPRCGAGPSSARGAVLAPTLQADRGAAFSRPAIDRSDPVRGAPCCSLKTSC